MKSILLDFDKRFLSFYDNEFPEFFHYNMFNHHFFCGAKAEIEFEKFLKLTNNENEKCCLFTDPPFGCRTEPLAHTIHIISEKYKIVNNSFKILPVFWIFPYFMETYVKAVLPQMEMCDYKINYTNHEIYHDGDKGRKQGSPVRIFTNVPLEVLELPTFEGYRFCKSCKRWVARENRHCNLCQKCPSKNGSQYVHCNLCGICVKPSYKHCTNCDRCTQINGHNCNEYQSNLMCSICLTKGHNEGNCIKWFEYINKSVTHIRKLKQKSLKMGKRICLVCFKSGHSEKFCTKRSTVLKETYFMSTCNNVLNSTENNDIEVINKI